MTRQILFSSAFVKRQKGELTDVFELPDNKVLVICKDKIQKHLIIPGKIIISFYSEDVVVGASFKYMVVVVYNKLKEKETQVENSKLLMHELFSGE
jgi:hypothetical protein